MTNKYIGSRVKRKEDPRLLTGNGRYVDDIKIVGQLHIAFYRSDHSHARICNIDTQAAKCSPGVIDVFTEKDICEYYSPVIAQSRMKNYQATVMSILAKDKVRYVGEPIVAVVAESRYAAEDAAALIAVDYEALPFITDPKVAAQLNAPKLHEELDSNILVERSFRRGDVEQAFWKPQVHIKEQFRFNRKTSVAMENRTYLANYDCTLNHLTLYSSTQVPGIIKDALSDLLNIPGNELRVIAPDVGGGFGGKTSLYPEEILVVLLARKLKKPVKWASDRLEDLTTTSQAFDELIDAEIAVDADGKILGLKAEVIGDVGAYSIYPWTAGIEPVQVISFLPGPYKIENYDAHVRAVATSKSPTGPYRGVGRPCSTFVMERLIDLASEQLDMDPKEMRLKNLVQPDEFPYKAASGIVWDKSGFVEGLNAACDAINYDELRDQQARARDEGRLFGIGISTFAELTGIGSRISASPGMPINTGTETASISIDSTGSIVARFGVASHGQGLETSLAQVVAEHLNVSIDSVRIIHGDSDAVAHSTGTYASRSAALGSGAAILATRALNVKLLKIASILLGDEEENIFIQDGFFFNKNTDKSLSLKALAKAYYSQMGSIPAELKEEIGDLSATKTYDPLWGTTSSATHVVALEIDRISLKVKISKYIVAEDCGQMINPLIVEGQVHGGVAQGIGAALFEEMVYDEQGQALSASLADYIVPAATEIPRIDIEHLDVELPPTLSGVRGMGESGTIGAPAAIANAISDALAPLDQYVTELPMTPERIFRLVQAAQNPSS